MKTINVDFEDEEFEEILKRKGSVSWRDYIIGLTPKNEADDNVI